MLKAFHVMHQQMPHRHGPSLYHGVYREGEYLRCGPQVPDLMSPRTGRLHATIAGRLWLGKFQLGTAWWSNVKYRMFALDWAREIEAERGRIPVSPDAYFRSEYEGEAPEVAMLMAEEIRIGTDSKVVEEREVKFPVVSERDVARLDVMEFRFDVRVWQVVSQRLADAIESAFPAVFRFDKVSVW